MRSPEFTIGCYGIVFEDEKVLLVHRTDYDFWSLPGGGINEGEALAECVKREVFEETGYRVEVNDLVGVYLKPEERDIVFTFHAKIIGGKPTLNDEASAIEFFPIKKLPTNIWSNVKERIEEAYSFRGKTIVKNHSSLSALKLVRKLRSFQLPAGEYAIFGSGPLVARGLRDSRDIDLIATEELYEKCRGDSLWQAKKLENGSEYLEREGIELYRDWGPGEWNIKELIRGAEIIAGLPFVRLEEVLKWKKIKKREKDLLDIELIERYLNTKSS